MHIGTKGMQRVFEILLQDKTTNRGIMWGTDGYLSYGERYGKNGRVLPAFKDWGDFVIEPRTIKERAQQQERTKRHAEVSTPSWVCNKMINYCDDDWFGEKAVFNREKDKEWERNDSSIEFPAEKTWKDYVSSRILEITCGEAPYIVSRYDASTGEEIQIEDRIGFLDRKLRVVGENTENEEEWFEWTKRAFQSVYGYEMLGDNLIICRINLLMTFADYVKHKWHREPNIKELRIIANIIAWNFWQMDGLKGTVPSEPLESQISIFDLSEDLKVEMQDVKCKIHNWRSGKTFLFNEVKERGYMKFDYVIGNPPYQEEANGNKKADASVYHLFMDASYQVADKVELITPARFLFDNGNTPVQWRKKMLTDNHFKVLHYDVNASNFFSNTDIKGGIAIHYRNLAEDYGSIGQFTEFEELNSILKKVQNKKEETIMNIIHNQNKFDLKALYSDYPNLKNNISSNGAEKRLTSGCFQLECFKEKRESDDDIAVIGLISNKRCYRYIKRKYLDSHPNLDYYKVILPANNGSGAIGEVLSTPLIGEPLIGYTQTFIAFGAFDTIEIAENAMKYIKSKFARALLGILKVTQNGKKPVWKYVPMQDFTSNSDIDWSAPVRGGVLTNSYTKNIA